MTELSPPGESRTVRSVEELEQGADSLGRGKQSRPGEVNKFVGGATTTTRTVEDLEQGMTRWREVCGSLAQALCTS